MLPIYEAHELLESALTSVAAQSLANWEAIVVDDGSHDGAATAAVVRAVGDRRIRLVRLPTNRGLAAALNVGLSEAKGRFVARMDADDAMAPMRLEEQVRFMRDERLSLCGTAARMVGAASGLIRNPRTSADIRHTFLCGNPFVHPTVMFDRERLGSALTYDVAFACEEDYELWARLILQEPCGNLDMVLLDYRVAPAGNANHPTKSGFNRIALGRFAARADISAICPVEALSEFQISGFVDEPAFRALASYARQAERSGAPRLGWLHGLVLAADYATFFDALNAMRGFVQLGDDEEV